MYVSLCHVNELGHPMNHSTYTYALIGITHLIKGLNKDMIAFDALNLKFQVYS